MVLFIELNVVEKYSDVQAFWVLWGDVQCGTSVRVGAGPCQLKD